MRILTANRLIDGRVVFRDADGRWVERFADAAVLDAAATETALAAAAADVAARRIVEPYAVEVIEVEGRREPKAMREKIRVSGPTSPSRAAADLSRAA
ncbi:MAG: DUF2849 domain-containing protein [Phyllobacteriaceae bacterium]|nr:DUF2849 domain-containing protein [Phyllobacteriaceae bacterium]